MTEVQQPTEQIALRTGQIIPAAEIGKIVGQTIAFSDKRPPQLVEPKLAAQLITDAIQSVFASNGHNTDGDFYSWRTNHWKLYNLLDLQHDVAELLGNNIKSMPKIEEVIKWMRTCNRIDHHTLDSKSFGLMTPNRIFQISNGTIQAVGHQRDNYNTWVLPYDIDLTLKGSAPPQFKKILDTLMPEAQHQELLQEFFGYVLHVGLNWQVWFILFGNAGTGKTTIIHILSELLGRKHCSALSASSIAKDHATASLLRKRLNASDETNYIGPDALNIMKMVTGGGDVHINQKFEPEYDTPLDVVFAIPTNQIPRLTDQSEAAWQRTVIIPFDHPVQNATGTKDLLNSVQSEMGKIMGWALVGLVRAMKRSGRNTRFTLSERCQQLMAEHREDSDTFLQFCNECIIVAAGEFAAKDDLYGHYRTWYATNNPSSDRFMLGMHGFNKRVREKYDPKEGQARLGIRRPRVWKGIKYGTVNDFVNDEVKLPVAAFPSSN
jgi:P4 family phage/plasmid primase-like protien